MSSPETGRDLTVADNPGIVLRGSDWAGKEPIVQLIPLTTSALEDGPRQESDIREPVSR